MTHHEWIKYMQTTDTRAERLFSLSFFLIRGAPVCYTVCSSESWKIFEPQCLPYQWSEEALFSILYWCTYCQTNPKVFPKNLENCGGYYTLN